MKRFDLLGVTLLGFWLWTGMPHPVLASETLNICADPNNPPFSDKKGGGFENEIAKMLADDQHKKIAYTWFPQRMGFIRNTLKSQDPDTKAYKCDVVMGVPSRYELAATTEPYYRSTYALVYVKKKGWDDIHGVADLDGLPAEKKARLRMAMFDGSPATTWMLRHNFIEQGVPYKTMTADGSVNTAQTLAADLAAGKIDMVIVWGPIAGYLVKHAGVGKLEMIPLASEDGVRFDYPMSMGVRFPDQALRDTLNDFIARKQSAITALLKRHNVPLLDEQGKLMP